VEWGFVGGLSMRFLVSYFLVLVSAVFFNTDQASATIIDFT
jgi:hypothetical protein